MMRGVIIEFQLRTKFFRKWRDSPSGLYIIRCTLTEYDPDNTLNTSKSMFPPRADAWGL